MLRVAVSLAFFGMLRSAEYTSPSQVFWDPQVHLGSSDVHFKRGGKVVINIKASKTDPFRVGSRIRLIRIGSKFFP